MASHGQSLAAASALASNESASVPRSSGGLGLSAADMMSSSRPAVRSNSALSAGAAANAASLAPYASWLEVIDPKFPTFLVRLLSGEVRIKIVLAEPTDMRKDGDRQTRS
jgi:hypothetical protein